MRSYALATLGALTLAAAVGAAGLTAIPVVSARKPSSPVAVPLHPKSKCVEVLSTGSFSCKDAGNFASTCAVAKCPAGSTLTGGGGACEAGDRKVKSLFPRLATGEFTITCEEQGVAPTAIAICCQL